MNRKIISLVFALVLMLCVAACAQAKPDTILEKNLEKSYAHESETLKIDIDQWHYAYKKHDLRFFVAHVYVDDPSQLMTAFAGEEYNKTYVEATSDIAARHDAVLAVNGDYYNYKDDTGLIIRNGVLYRDKKGGRDHLLVMNDGSFEVIYRSDYVQGSGEEQISRGAVQCFFFGPALVDNGEAVEIYKKYIINTTDETREPRSAIGWAGGNHYIFVIADGRRNGWSEKGMTLQELQQVFLEEGALVAYNLDGGGSASLYFEGERINQSSGTRERSVSDIVYIAK